MKRKMQKKDEPKRVTVLMSKNLFGELEKIKKQYPNPKCPMSCVIRMALREWISYREYEAKENARLAKVLSELSEDNTIPDKLRAEFRRQADACKQSGARI